MKYFDYKDFIQMSAMQKLQGLLLQIDVIVLAALTIMHLEFNEMSE